MYRSVADGRIGTWVAAELQGWTQHYSVDVCEQIPDYVVVRACRTTSASARVADPAAGGDAGLDQVRPVRRRPGDAREPVGPAIAYACSQYGGCGRTLAGAPDVRFSMPSARYGWFADIELDPTNPAIMYTGSERVFRSTDGGGGWPAISDDLSSDPEQTDPNPGYRLRGVVTTIAPAQDGQTV